jgi:hypothetical protein
MMEFLLWKKEQIYRFICGGCESMGWLFYNLLVSKLLQFELRFGGEREFSVFAS